MAQLNDDAPQSTPKEIPQEEMSTYVIQLHKKEKRVSVQGNIADIGDFYTALEMAKDAVREWNKLNNNYLNAQPTTGSLPHSPRLAE